MARLDGLQAGLSRRGWPAASARPELLLVIGLVDAIALAWGLIALTTDQEHGAAWLTVALLAVVAIGFEEGSRRAARLQIRLATVVHSDMTSVWVVAAAVTLSSGQAVVLLALLFGHIWFRQQRPAGEPLHRKTYTASSNLIACLLSGVLIDAIRGGLGSAPWAVSTSLAVVVAIVVTSLVGRILIVAALLTIGVRGRELLGSRHDNLVELATLCLGGLVSLAVLYQPWLVFLVIAPMVTLQRGALVRELEAAAMTDGKTGLLNALAWEQLAQREIARAVREDQPLGVLLVDVDRFKTVNDRFGHLAGDRVLRAVGKTIESGVREYDGVGRFGGEEFVAVLPGADEVVALEIAERVRAAISELALQALVDDDQVDAGGLSVSIGVACMPTDGYELSDLLPAADQALYSAKANGRNQVRLAHRGGGVSEQALVG